MFGLTIGFGTTDRPVHGSYLDDHMQHTLQPARNKNRDNVAMYSEKWD
jgi:hypothetical protein